MVLSVSARLKLLGVTTIGVGLVVGVANCRHSAETASEDAADQQSSAASWYRGNLHTHSLWSDGDEFPESVIDWYKSRGYDFVALSDHNTLGDDAARFVPVLEPGEPPQPGAAIHRAFETYRERFGDAWVEQRRRDGRTEVRLKTFAEYRALLEEKGVFLTLRSEEITSRFEDKPIHVNGTNLVELVEPRGGASVSEVMQNNVDAVLEQRRRTGQPMFPHINHPNYQWAIALEDMMALEGDRFFEVYNGHPLVHNEGTSEIQSTERMWDVLVSERLSENREIPWGLAVDDSHNYQEMGADKSNPGRGWVMVRAPRLDAESLIASMEAGDFYATSGVMLDEITSNETGMSLSIRGEQGVSYLTEFIGTRRGYDRAIEEVLPGDNGSRRRYSLDIGVVLAEVAGPSAAYRFQGDELYVRARVSSSKLKENPYAPGEHERAWIQPQSNGRN